jgi:hypothetical protein
MLFLEKSGNPADFSICGVKSNFRSDAKGPEIQVEL